jgi:hypothetical protein
MIDRADRQIALEVLEGLFDLGELQVLARLSQLVGGSSYFRLVHGFKRLILLGMDLDLPV